MSEMEAGVEEVSATPENGLDQLDESDDDAMVTDGSELALPSDEMIESDEGVAHADVSDDNSLPNAEYCSLINDVDNFSNDNDHLMIDDQLMAEDEQLQQLSDVKETSNEIEDTQDEFNPMSEIESSTPEVITNESQNAASLESDSSPVTSPNSLPDCKNKRSYVCGYCNIITKNPRVYLYHLRDEHKESMKIFECSNCIYASKSLQKLLRHKEMVHKIQAKAIEMEIPVKKKAKKGTKTSSKDTNKSTYMNRSPRESKSPRRFEEYEFPNDDDDDCETGDEVILPEKCSPTTTKTVHKCDQCEYSCTNAKVLAKHDNKFHFKSRSYKCARCNYTTNVRTRYTKHMKYHSLKIVKCEFCDFRTPYPWNMDRHNKNHIEDSGEHKCHLCNFSAQIKQSLTVHVTNHHLTNEQIRERESKRTIGVTDQSEEVALMDEESELLRMERDEDPDSLEIPSSFTVSSIDMGFQEDMDSAMKEEDPNSEETKKKPKIKITLKKTKSLKASIKHVNERYKDFIHPDDIVQRNGKIYVKKEKCSLCNFKAPFIHEIVRHKQKFHGIQCLKDPSTGTFIIKKQKKKSGESVLINGKNLFNEDGVMTTNPFEELSNFVDENATKKEKRSSNVENDQDNSNEEDESNKNDGSSQKRKSSFFDKLKEKLSVSNVQNLICQFCGHESKCLSESVRHQKLHLSAKNIYSSASLSTRCQFCRHRCKTTDDLMNHLKSCPEARKNQINDNMKDKTNEKQSSKQDDDYDVKHPMENKVFVWNNLDDNLDDEDRSGTPTGSTSDGTDAGEQKASGKKGKSKVFKCRQCSFRSTTASRFHVHMVGHYNIKPYSCSQCSYRSNWRWDITKHIKLKIVKDKSHETAEVMLSHDALLEKNYDKYDEYLTEVNRDEVHHSEGGLSNSRKGPSKRTSLHESDGSDSAKSSPCPTPNPSNNTKLPAPPKLTRAPNRLSNPLEPLIAGENQKPPPLVAMATQSVNDLGSTSGLQEDNNSADQSDLLNSQTMLSQTVGDDMSTSSLETLQLLTSGSNNLARLKRQQQETGEGKNPELDAAVSNQMRLLLWLNCLVGGTDLKEGDSTSETVDAGGSSQNTTNDTSLTGDSSSLPNTETMKLVLDHEGNPEWKCSTCDFRDNEQDTVTQHVRLAHGKKGPVSLVHAVHRCSVCGFAAGTKRHVQVHLEQTHNGQGGIISRSEGQNVESVNGVEERSYDCKMCPFKSKKKGELKLHLNHHTPRTDFIFKCMFCSYFVATKNELFSHLALHGMDIPETAKDTTEPITTNVTSQPVTDDSAARQFTCDMCPFETRIRAKMMHHRQFHRPRGLPFSCPHCSYNVTRRHLLAQHLLIHGVNSEGVAKESGNKQNLFGTDPLLVRKSPSPSLTITPISSIGSLTVNGNNPASNIDPSCLPILSDLLTKNLHDIPLVWVSRENRFFKMFKCRHCPHVNLRKTNIQEHEKMHRPEGLAPGTGHTCKSCTYVCINAGVMSAHIKVHSGSMGTCHAIVDPALVNEEQLKMLADSRVNKISEDKFLYYCQHCPARFFLGKEVQIHSRFHSSNYPCLCNKCNFRAREESQVLAHAKVHTTEYQERTRTLMSMHPPAPNFPPVSGLAIPADKRVFGVKESEVNNCKDPQSNSLSRPWLAAPLIPASQGSSLMPQPPPTSRFKCDLCPSSFTKQITLQYHQSLHGADNPYGCGRCNYSAKTPDGLRQHSALHDQADREKNSTTSSFRSATPSPAPSPSPQKMIENALGLTTNNSNNNLSNSTRVNLDQPPIKLKFIGLKGNGTSSKSMKKQQFKYYIEEQVPLSGIELLKRKHQIEQELPKDATAVSRPDLLTSKPNGNKQMKLSEERTGNPDLNYPLHIDKATGRTREKRYKCLKCPSAFDKMDQFNVHINLHGTHYKYKCKLCNYTVKFYANFMMHIKRHKYHEIINAQNKGLPPPKDDDLKFEPTIGLNLPPEQIMSEITSQDKENVYNFTTSPDMTTAEKQLIVLQTKKPDAFLPKDEDKDKRTFYCEFCPYSSPRRDGVDSHSLRHQANGGKGYYQCNFCDYTASGPNFIREHTKVHFKPFKSVIPEGFMKHDKLELWSIKSGEELQMETVVDVPKKSQIFKHDDGVFGPSDETEAKITECEVKEDPSDDCSILVDFRSGDVVHAPDSFIIPLRPSKSKPTHVSKSKGKKARKHTKLKCPTEHQQNGFVVNEPMEFEEETHSVDICNGDTSSINGTVSPAEDSSKQDDEILSDESNQYLETVSSLTSSLVSN